MCRATYHNFARVFHMRQMSAKIDRGSLSQTRRNICIKSIKQRRNIKRPVLQGRPYHV